MQIQFTSDSAETSFWEALQLAAYWALFKKALEGERKAIKTSTNKMIRPVMIIFIFFVFLGVTRTGNFSRTSWILVKWTYQTASRESGQEMNGDILMWPVQWWTSYSNDCENGGFLKNHQRFNDDNSTKFNCLQGVGRMQQCLSACNCDHVSDSELAIYFRRQILVGMQTNE